MTRHALSFNGRDFGYLTGREEEIYQCGKVAALAKLRVRVSKQSGALKEMVEIEDDTSFYTAGEIYGYEHVIKMIDEEAR